MKSVCRIVPKAILGGLLLASVFATSSIATLLSATDLNAPGDGLLTLDSGTGLQWLDLTLTTGLSYNQVSAQLGPGGQFEGFRYASIAEVVELWQNADIDTSTLPGGSFDPANFAPIGAFQALIGVTGASGVLVDSIAFAGDDVGGGNRATPFVRIRTDSSQGVVNTTNTRTSDQFQSDWGSWLVIPEPSTLALLAIGGFSLFLRRRR